LYKYGFFSYCTYISGGAGGIVYVFHAAAALLWAWAGSVFGYVLKRLVLAPRSDLVSWIATAGVWAGRLHQSSPVVYGHCHLFVEVLPGAHLQK